MRTDARVGSLVRMSSSLQEPGTLLVGKYRVERTIGAGGMGVVVAARHEQLGQRVAVKFLLPELCEEGTVVSRFLREARASVQITSEHVARVIDVGTIDDEVPYMVMEYLDGHDLSDEVRKRGQVPVPEAVGYVLQATEAVAEAHRLGIVHRDLKPGNLFLTKRADGTPLVKVLDFGISKLLEPDGAMAEASLTKTQSMLGSPLYASPEQLRDSKHVDQRTDIWAFGVVLYELITGQTPFIADSLTGLLAIIVADPHEPMSKFCDEVPAGLEEVIDRCLAKDRERRYANVGELARALLPFAPRSARISAERVTRVLGSPPMDEPPPSELAPAALQPRKSGPGHTAPLVKHASTTGPVSSEALKPSTPPEATRSRFRLYVGAAAAVIVLGGAAALAMRSPHAPAAAAEPSAAAAPSAVAPAATAPPTPSVTPAPPPSAAVSAAPAPSAATAPSASAAPPQKRAATSHPAWHAPATTKKKPKSAAYDPLAGRQ